jgi:hypothetical protein
MDDESDHLVDPRRSTSLCDVGQPDYLAAVIVTSEGTEHLLLAERKAIGDETVCFAATCPDIHHEQLGKLPAEYARRITVSRPTPKGNPTDGHRSAE